MPDIQADHKAMNVGYVCYLKSAAEELRSSGVVSKIGQIGPWPRSHKFQKAHQGSPSPEPAILKPVVAASGPSRDEWENPMEGSGAGLFQTKR